MLTKGPAGNGRSRQEVASSGVTGPPRHHEEKSFLDGLFCALVWLSSASGRFGGLLLDRVTQRRRAAQLARHYRDQEGLSIAEIARRLGRAEGTVKAYL
jgi:Sigma-70, region 4